MAIKLLTLNHLELKDAVAQELVENPVHEEAFDDRIPNESREEAPAPAPTAERPAEVTTQPAQQEPQIDWEGDADSYNYRPPRPAVAAKASTTSRVSIRRSPAARPSRSTCSGRSA